jgi:hypothetical protein
LPGSGFSYWAGLFWVDANVSRTVTRRSRVAIQPAGVAPPSARAGEALVPDGLASTANLLKANGWRAGASYGEDTANFEVMREWNRAVIYRKTIVLFAERLRGS